MASQPADIRIDDLASPRMPQGFDAMVASMKPMADALAFEPAAMIDAARKKTGLDDFGPSGWERGLEVAERFPHRRLARAQLLRDARLHQPVAGGQLAAQDPLQQDLLHLLTEDRARDASALTVTARRGELRGSVAAPSGAA